MSLQTDFAPLYLGRTNRIMFGSAAPTSGRWENGDMIFNNNFYTANTTGAPLIWLCTVGGSPGTWVAKLPMQDPSVVRAVTANTTLALTDNILTVSSASAVTVTLPVVTSAANGLDVSIVNLGSGTVALAATSSNLVGVAGIAATSQGEVMISGSKWYRIA